MYEGVCRYMTVKKAVIPAAGLGTRFLPVTKSMPKEMLPIIDKPVIHYVVEEAVDSGIEDILLITGRGKRANHAGGRFRLPGQFSGRFREIQKGLAEFILRSVRQVAQFRPGFNKNLLHQPQDRRPGHRSTSLSRGVPQRRARLPRRFAKRERRSSP